MAANRDIASFPFRPHLAKYLFYSIRNGTGGQKDNEDYQHLDINMSSPDGKYLRILFSRANVPSLKRGENGYRLTVSIARQTGVHRSLTHDGRYSALEIPEEVAELINDYYEARFRGEFIAYVSGYIAGSGNIGSLREGINQFLNAFDLNDPEGYNYEKMRQFYYRRNSPVKKSIYAKEK